MSDSVVHCIAECLDCPPDKQGYPRRWENYLTARKLAMKHSAKTGHRVVGESGTSWAYGPPREV